MMTKQIGEIGGNENMKRLIRELLEEIVENNDVYVAIEVARKEIAEDETIVGYKRVTVDEYKANKEKYEKNFSRFVYAIDLRKFKNININILISALPTKNMYDITVEFEQGLQSALYTYFHEITTRENFKSDKDYFRHIDALVEEHMKLYSAGEIQDILKDILDIR